MTGRWVTIDRNPQVVKVVGARVRAQLLSNGRIYSGFNLEGGWFQWANNPSTVDIAACGADADLYRLDSGGMVFHYSGIPLTGWQQIANNPELTAIESAGSAVYALDKRGNILSYTGRRFEWNPIATNPDVVQLATHSNGTLYALTWDGVVFKYGGVPGNWSAIANNPQAFSICAGGDGNFAPTVYALERTGVVWKYSGTGQVWSQIADADTIQITADDATVYRLVQSRNGTQIDYSMVEQYTGDTSWTALTENPDDPDAGEGDDPPLWIAASGGGSHFPLRFLASGLLQQWPSQ